MLKSLCIVAEDYPMENHPAFTFVQQLAYSLSAEGVQCSVVAPQSLVKALFRGTGLKKINSVDISTDGHSIRVYRPYTVTFSNTKSPALCWIRDRLSRVAIWKGLKKFRSCDAIYCYFWHVGLLTSDILQKKGVKGPLFVQASECDVTVDKRYRKNDLFRHVAGVICASGKNHKESVENGFLAEDAENCVIVPNGFSKECFYQMDKKTARRKLGYPVEVFIVAFVGGFIERKGVPQLSSALSRFSDVYSIFIGQGNVEPKCSNILFKGTVPHERIANYLNCADLFVLPTSAEGCCNAIIEALACGLPVVSSNKSFNNEILDDECAIRIDEQDANSLFEAICELKNDKTRLKKMSLAAIEKANELSIEKRAKRIKEFIESCNGEAR